MEKENHTKEHDGPKCPKCKAPMVKLEACTKPLPKDALKKIKQLKELSDYVTAPQIWICNNCLVLGLCLD